MDETDRSAHPGSDSPLGASLPPVDLVTVLADGVAVDSLSWLVSQIRPLYLRLADEGDESSEPAATEQTLLRLSLGNPIDQAEAATVLGARRFSAMVDCGLLVEHEAQIVARVILLFVRGLAVAYPFAQAFDDSQVYIGLEAPWLMKLAFRHGPGTGSAAELATGTGIVGAALSARYEQVVVADIAPSAARCAALTLRLNQTTGAVTGAVVADVAAGLRAGAFDLVVANPPWVPLGIAKDRAGRSVLYSTGGPTGMELPARFIDQMSELLKPGGVGIVVVSDTDWNDGRRPLDEQVAKLHDRGFDVEIEPPHESVWKRGQSQEFARSIPGCTGCRVVGLVFRRPLS